jgi:capsular exopolysaccharide synthesis family protein
MKHVDLRERFAKLSLEVDRKSMDYSTLQRNAITDRGVFDTLLQRAKEIGIAGELKSGNVRILDEADVPRKPIWPDKRRGVPILVVASACLAIIAAFGVERLDRRIKSPEAIKLELGLPLLGLVPKIRTRRKRSATTLIDGGAPAHFLEAFGNLRATVLLAPGHHTGSVIVVASAGPREGKTLVASNLAVAVAQAGQRVLLVDVDLRCPKVHEVFNHPLTPGLAESLAGTVQAKMTIRPTLVPGLSVLPAGAHSGNPGATLASAEFKACIAALSREFDLIVLDSPPVLAVGDAVVVAAEASGLVFVVSAASTRRQTAMAALQRLDATGVPLLGVVLNQVDVEGHPYYYDPYYRREYKSYYVRSTGVTEHQDKGSWT